MSGVPPRPILALPCPECRLRGVTGMARIGNQRSKCSTCNNFAANVRRMVQTRLKANHEDEYEELRILAERDLYPQVIDDWTAAHPVPSYAEEAR